MMPLCLLPALNHRGLIIRLDAIFMMGALGRSGRVSSWNGVCSGVISS
jgi:hypothetical protein